MRAQRQRYFVDNAQIGLKDRNSSITLLTEKNLYKRIKIVWAKILVADALTFEYRYDVPERSNGNQISRAIKQKPHTRESKISEQTYDTNNIEHPHF